MLNRFSKLLPSWLRTPRKPAILSDLDSIVIGEETHRYVGPPRNTLREPHRPPSPRFDDINSSVSLGWPLAGHRTVDLRRDAHGRD